MGQYKKFPGKRIVVSVTASDVDAGEEGSFTRCAAGLPANHPNKKEEIRQAFDLSVLTSEIEIGTTSEKNGIGLTCYGRDHLGRPVKCDAFAVSEDGHMIATCNDKGRSRVISRGLTAGRSVEIVFDRLRRRDARQGNPAGSYATSSAASARKPENFVRDKASRAGRAASTEVEAKRAGRAAARVVLQEKNIPVTDRLLKLAGDRSVAAFRNKGSQEGKPRQPRLTATGKRFAD